MRSITEQLKKTWSTQGIKLRSEASPAQLAAFETKYKIRLPGELSEFLAAVNGFDCSESLMWDEELITFLGTDEIKPLGEYWSPEAEGSEMYFVFADHCIAAHVYAIHLSDKLDHENEIVVVYDLTPVKVATSFREFIQGYMNKDLSVLFPKPY